MSYAIRYNQKTKDGRSTFYRRQNNSVFEPISLATSWKTERGVWMAFSKLSDLFQRNCEVVQVITK